MTALTIATVVAWLLSLWCAARALRGGGVLRTLRRLFAAVVFAFFGVLLGGLLVLSRAFHAFAGETRVARVTTSRLSPEEFELTYFPVEGGRSLSGPWRAAEARVRLRGDQWAISGGVVKWHPWLTALGFPSYHKPMRLSGQFSSVQQQRAHLPTVYALEPSTDLVWEALYRADAILPFVEAAYGSSASVYVEPAVTQDISVTSTGYLIKRARR